MIKFVLKKYYLIILISSALLIVSNVLIKNIYIATTLTMMVFTILPYYITKNSFIAINQEKIFYGNYVREGFLSGGVVNLLLSFAGLIESFRELFVTTQGLGRQLVPYSGQIFYQAVFVGISSIIIFPILMFFIGGTAGFLASRSFRKIEQR
jgi:hypothetical protein